MTTLRLVDACKVVTGLAPITPSSSTPDYVNLENYNKVAVVIAVDNGSTVTGSDITLLQATDASGTGAKAVAFADYWANIDTAASDTLTLTTATSNTFTTDATNAKNLLYVIEIDVDDLDTDNGFVWFRAGTGNGANMVACVLYFLLGPRYQSPVAVTAIA